MSLASPSSSVASPVSATLSEFITASRWEDIPQKVRHEATRSLMNYFAVALGGCQDPAIVKASHTFRQFSSGKQATIIGRGERSDVLHAASLNAMSANVFDFDDTHIPTIIHPTAPVAPPLFALAEATPTSGCDLLHALVLGMELECRIGNAISPGHYARGWHITSTCGVFGSAAAVGKRLGLSAEQMNWALGNASSQASGLVETLGFMAKSFGVGSAAKNGILSALLAQEGFDGPAQPLEGPRGFLRVVSDQPDIDSLVEGLGQRWEVLMNTYKPYPCGVVLNPVIEACLGLAAGQQLPLDDIERITLTGHSLLRQRTDRPHVKTGREAQVSAQHAVAVVLTTGRAGLEEFSDTRVADPALRELGKKVAFVDDDSYAIEAVDIRIALKNGKTVDARIDAALGSQIKPLSDADLEKKLRTLCDYGRSGCDAAALIDAVWAIEHTADAGKIMALAAGKRGRP